MLNPLNEDDSEFNRYVNSDNKIKFRVRASTSQDFPVSNNDADNMTMQLVGKNVDVSKGVYAAFPWYTNTGFDSGFDWSKVKNSEIVSSLSASYFKSASI